jgi:hypothetical protein
MSLILIFYYSDFDKSGYFFFIKQSTTNIFLAIIFLSAENSVNVTLAIISDVSEELLLPDISQNK